MYLCSIMYYHHYTLLLLYDSSHHPHCYHQQQQEQEQLQQHQQEQWQGSLLKLLYQYCIYVHCFMAHFTAQNIRLWYVVQRVVMPFNLLQCFSKSLFCVVLQSKHLQCHNWSLSLYISPYPSISIRDLLHGCQDWSPRSARSPTFPRPVVPVAGTDETRPKSWTCSAFAMPKGRLGPWEAAWSRLLWSKCSFAFVKLRNHASDPSASKNMFIDFLSLSFAQIECKSMFWARYYVQIHRGLTEIIQNLSMPPFVSLSLSLSLFPSLSIHYEWIIFPL